jgi:hypothetical protein
MTASNEPPDDEPSQIIVTHWPLSSEGTNEPDPSVPPPPVVEMPKDVPILLPTPLDDTP